MSIQEKRESLKALSNKATELREELLHNCKNDAEIQEINDLTINQILIKHFYKNDKHREFKTFKGWLKVGKCVIKGEKAFLVWGRPKDVQEQEKNPNQEKDENETTFFPISYIFSNAQVQELKDKKSA